MAYKIVHRNQNRHSKFSSTQILSLIIIYSKFRCLICWVSIVIKISLENKSVRSKKTNSIIDFNQNITPGSCFLAFLLVLSSLFPHFSMYENEMEIYITLKCAKSTHNERHYLIKHKTFGWKNFYNELLADMVMNVKIFTTLVLHCFSFSFCLCCLYTQMYLKITHNKFH